METQASLVVSSTALTAQAMITTLGLQPDRQVNQGDPIPNRNSKRKRSCISIRSQLAKKVDIEEHAAEIMRRLQGREAALRVLSEQADVRAFFSIFSKDSCPSIYFEQPFIRFLADINATLGIDVYPFE